MSVRLGRCVLRIVWTIVAVEAIGAGYLVSERLAQKGPPSVNLTQLDPISANELREQQEAVVAGTAESWVEVARAYTAYTFLPQASQCCAEAVRRNPNLYEARFQWGLILDRMGRMEEAIEQFEAATELAPEQDLAASCWYHIGRNYLRLQRPEPALAAFRASRGFPRAGLEIAKLLIRDGRAKEALPLLERLVEEEDSYHDYYELKARAHDAVNEPEEAAAHRDRAQRADNPVIHDHVGEMLRYQANSHGLEGLMSYCRLLFKQEQFTAIVGELSVVAEQTDSTSVTILMARSELARGRPRECVKLIEGLRRAETVGRSDLLVLGQAYRALEQDALAVEVLTEAANRPMNPNAHRELAAMFEGTEPDRARFHQARAEFIRAQGLYRQNGVGHAKVLFENVVELQPEFAPAWFYLAECRRLVSRRAQAVEAYRQCAALDPNHGRCLARLASLETESSTPANE